MTEIPDTEIPAERPSTAKPPDATHASKVNVFETVDSADTIREGRELAKLLTPPLLLILRGDLGTGKTTLVKGIAQELHAAEPDEVTSPTFTLVHEYEGSLADKPLKLYHLDLYRIETERQLESVGIDELAASDAIVLIEWGEKFKSIIGRANGEILIETTGGNSRKITVTLNRR